MTNHSYQPAKSVYNLGSESYVCSFVFRVEECKYEMKVVRCDFSKFIFVVSIYVFHLYNLGTI